MRAALLLALVVGLGGCVERKLYVRTDPPDAHVTIDGLDLGTGKAGAPVTLTYEHYGIRRIVARAEGRTPVERLEKLDPPWWQVFPLDFFTDVLIPYPFTDEREVTLELPAKPAPTRADAEAAEARARTFGEEAQEKKP